MRAMFIPVLLLVACGPAPAPVPEPGASTPFVDTTPGWNEVEPNTCHLDEFAQYQGQPGAVVDSAGITRPYRMIPKGGIVTQEYAAARVNFWLNRSGDVERIGCG